MMCVTLWVNTLENFYNCLKDESPEIKVDAEIAGKRLKPIKRMNLEISAKTGIIVIIIPFVAGKILRFEGMKMI